MRPILFLLFIISNGPSVFSQNKAEEALANLFDNYPQEKVIINLTKENYVAGENLVFKAYVANAYQPSVLSSNLYVELYDRRQQLVEQRMVPLYRGSGEGNFVLPSSTAEGIYYLRAYTTWMQNFAPQFEYLQTLKIFNPYSSRKLVLNEQPLSGEVFVEGGTLRAGITSKVVVRLRNNPQLPSHWQATIFEAGSKEPLSSEPSLNPQLAILHIIPQEEKSYIVRLKENGRDLVELPLPEVRKDGIVFRLVNHGSRIDYELKFANNSHGEGYKIIGTMHDEQVYKAEIRKSPGSISGNIKTSSYPNGILRLTVFDEKESPVAERLTFIGLQQLKTATPELKFDTLNFLAKEKNVWQLSVDSGQWYSYAVQVQDASLPQPNNFLSTLYLTSDIVSDIWNPSWYFENIHPQTADALDALLITETWQRFQWKDILSGKFPIIKYIPEKYLSYLATVTRKNKAEALKEVNLIFQDSEGFTQLRQTPVDSSGRFVMQHLFFLDSMKVFYQLNQKKGAARDIRIQFDSVHRHLPLRTALPSTHWTLVPRQQKDSLPGEIKNALAAINSSRIYSEKSRVLQEVIINYQRKNPTQQLDDQLSSGLFKSMNEIVFDFVNDDHISANAYTNILEWLQGRVPGYRLENQNGNLIPYIRNERAGVYVDEFQMDPTLAYSVTASDVAMIKVFRGAFMGSAFGGGSAIAIYTLRDGMRSKNFPGLPFSSLSGYKKTMPLFEPDYSVDRLRDVPDDREILIRRHELAPDENNRTKLLFYNNDHAKAFRIIVTGFSSEGIPVYLNQLVQPKN